MLTSSNKYLLLMTNGQKGGRGGERERICMLEVYNNIMLYISSLKHRHTCKQVVHVAKKNVK